MNKLYKSITLFISSLLLLFAAFVIAGAAEDSTQTPGNVEILYHNLEYKDNIHILYAAQVDGTASEDTIETFTLNFYTKQKNDDGSYSYKLANSVKGDKKNYDMIDTDSDGIDDTPVYIFRSIGIPSKLMTMEVYAQLSVDGTDYKSEMDSFSIAQYCYKRLYNDKNTDETQRVLYQNILNFGESVQTVLNYNIENKPSDFCYVNIDGGVAYTRMIAGCEYDFNAGIFKKSTKITLPSYEKIPNEGFIFAYWNVTAFGSETVSRAVGDEMEITDHTIITPEFRRENTDAPSNIGVYYNAEKSDPENHYGKNIDDLSSGTVNLTVTDKNGYYNITGSSGKSNIYTIDDSVENLGNTIIYEMDVRFVNATKSNSFKFTTYTGSAKIEHHFGYSNENGIINYNNTPIYSAENFDRTFLMNSWFNLRIEMYYLDETNYIVKYYINNDYAATYNMSCKADTSSVGLQIRFEADDYELDIANLYIGGSDKSYTEEGKQLQ